MCESGGMAQHLSLSCLFCKIVRGEIPCHKLAETERALAFLDINPLSKGHAVSADQPHGEGQGGGGD